MKSAVFFDDSVIALKFISDLAGSFLLLWGLKIVPCTDSRIRYVERNRYTGLRTEPIGEGKKKKVGPDTYGRKVIDSEKYVIPRIGKAKKMFGILRKGVMKLRFQR